MMYHAQLVFAFHLRCLTSFSAYRNARVLCRLKYLLSQSDIFSHFGAVKTDTTGSGNAPAGKIGGSASLSKAGSANNLAKSASATNVSKSGRRNRAASEELDEDEKAMVREEDDDEENDGEDDTVGKHAVLRVQPSSITGGKMRCASVCSLCTCFVRVLALPAQPGMTPISLGLVGLVAVGGSVYSTMRVIRTECHFIWHVHIACKA
jgi:hypothetical protein